MMEMASAPVGSVHAVQPGMAAAVQHMAGMLWYAVLSELNKTGLNSDALGTGGDDFQGMFLWNVAQNDFGKYDSALTAAMLRQVGGVANMAPAVDVALPVPQGTAVGGQAAVVAAPEDTQPAKDLLTQARQFVKSVWPQISAAAQALGVPPVAVLAQSALETGWGSAAPGNNLFGIKAVDGEAASSRPTHEMVDGVLTAQNAAFRDYASTQDSVSDYVGQIQAGFPAVVGQSTVQGFAGALQQAGYATDMNYAHKIIKISSSPLMVQALAAVGAPAHKAGGS
jgi:flagellar protein FlgJ